MKFYIVTYFCMSLLNTTHNYYFVIHTSWWSIDTFIELYLVLVNTAFIAYYTVNMLHNITITT